MPPSDTIDSEQASDRILKAALGVFAEFGYEGATTREIARRAMVHQPNIAYYFGNKEELWKAAVEDSFQKFESVVTDGMQANKGDRLMVLSEIFVRWVVMRPDWFAFIFHESMTVSPRTHWFIENWLTPCTRMLYTLASDSKWPAEGSPKMIHAVILLSMLSGSAAIIVQREQVLAMSGIDTHDEAFVGRHIKAMHTTLTALM